MSEHNTFTLQRSYPKTPDRVFAAFSNPSLKRRWAAEGHNHDVESFAMDFREGGSDRVEYRMNASTPFPGMQLLSEEHYLDIVPGERIVSASSMSIGGNRISVALATFEFAAEGATGTRLTFTHQAVFFPGADGPRMRQDGWNQLLDKLGVDLEP